MAKDDKKLLLVAQEIKLVKILAGNSKKLREKTIKQLSNWLNGRSSAAPLTEEALMRIWKGLFYAMWMSDKPLIQEDCAEKIANLVHLNDIKTSLMFFKCFLQTMVNEFFGIDQYRVDKFLMLIRRVLRHTLLVLQENDWQDELINEFREILNQTILKIDKNTALGLCLHIDEIFLEELAKVSKGELSENKVIELIQPFAQQLARVDDKRQIQQITTHIFKHLINQTDIAIEYKEKFDAWKRQGFPGGSIDAMESITVEEDPSLENDGPEADFDGPKDPRAGKVDVILPQIKFDPVDVIKLLEDIKFKKYTTSNGRKAITKLVKQFKLLSEGKYPLGLTQIPIDEESYKTSIKQSLKKLENFQKTLTKDSKTAKQKARKHKKAQEFALQQINNKPDVKTNEPQLKKQKKAKTIEEFIENSESHLFNNKTQGNKRKLDSKNDINKKSKIPKLEETLQIKSQNYFRRNSGMWQVDEFEIPESPEKKQSEWEKPLQDGETEYFVVSKKTKKKLKRLGKNEKIIYGNPKKWENVTHPPISDEEEDNGFTEKIMYATPKKKQIVKNPFSEEITPRGERKIKFSNKIDAQEFTDHEKQIINSPVIPYDATKKPTKSLLKASPFSSPINPFYSINN